MTPREYLTMYSYCRAERALGRHFEEACAVSRGAMPRSRLAQDAAYQELLRRACDLWTQLPRTLRDSIARPDHEE